MNNSQLRSYAIDHNVRLWQIAERFGYTDVTFSKKLRHELNDKDATRFIKYVDEIYAESGGITNEENSDS